MGMTFNDHIEVLKSYNHGFTAQAGNLQDSINVAIDTMRKYQKIQQIIAMDDENHRRTIRLADLKEVLEDGNYD